jgi:hypothetical protein
LFDLLEVDGDDLRQQPLFERRRALHAHVEPARGIQIIEHVETHGEALFRAIAEQDHERRRRRDHILDMGTAVRCYRCGGKLEPGIGSYYHYALVYRYGRHLRMGP